MYKNYGELGSQPEKNVDQFSVIDISDINHKRQIIGQNRVVVIDIHADWCGPCRQIAPDYSVMATKYKKEGECVLVKENLDKALSQNITGVPTFHFIVEGRKVDEVVGADLEQVETKLLSILQKTQSSKPIQQGPGFNRNAVRQYGNVLHGQNIQSDPHSVPYRSDQSGPIYHQPYNQTPHNY